MVVDKEGELAIVFQENTSLEKFLEELKQEYTGLKHNNLIINLISFSNLSVKGVLRFQELSDLHRAGNKSFVMVTEKVAYDELPESLVVVPTLQEARDLIEMEEIERDLEL